MVSGGLRNVFRKSPQDASRAIVMRFRMVTVKASGITTTRFRNDYSGSATFRCVCDRFWGFDNLLSNSRLGSLERSRALAGGSRISDWVSSAGLETVYKKKCGNRQNVSPEGGGRGMLVRGVQSVAGKNFKSVQILLAEVKPNQPTDRINAVRLKPKPNSYITELDNTEMRLFEATHVELKETGLN